MVSLPSEVETHELARKYDDIYSFLRQWFMVFSSTWRLQAILV